MLGNGELQEQRSIAVNGAMHERGQTEMERSMFFYRRSRGEGK